MLSHNRQCLFAGTLFLHAVPFPLTYSLSIPPTFLFLPSLHHSVGSPPGSPHPVHYHLITVTTFALAIYHCLCLSLQT